MPTPCNNCDMIFDLHDGYRSEKWFPDVTICEDCHDLEEKEIEMDAEIESMEDEISDAKQTLKILEPRLKEFKAKQTSYGELINS